MSRCLLSFILFFCCLSCTIQAQDLPATQIFSFDLEENTPGNIFVKNPAWLTAFNPEGYNDQPVFVNSSLIFFSIRMPGSDQNDIYALELSSRKRYPVTSTKEGEYSPYVSSTYQTIYCVQTDALNPGRQRLWQYPLDRSHHGSSVWETELEVGYFIPVDDQTFALFVLGDPNRLFFYEKDTERAYPVSERIGRCLKTDENGDLFYIHKINDDIQYLKLYERDQRTAKILTRFPNGTEDFFYMDDKIWYGTGAELFVFELSSGKHKPVADLSKYGITDITRLVIQNNLLILVNRT